MTGGFAKTLLAVMQFRASDSRKRSWRHCHRSWLIVATVLAAAIACGSDRAGDEKTSTGEKVPPPGQTAAPAKPTEKAPWNVVLITLDTVRADALGAYGQHRQATPNIDRMASEGVVFDAVVSSSPSTLPSHATIFTGKQPYAHGVRSNHGYALPNHHVTLAEALRRAGYRTGAEIAAVVMNSRTQIAQGFEQIRDPLSEGIESKKAVRASDGAAVDYPIRIARDIARRGIEFVRRNRDRKFFLWLHFFDAHVPRRPPRLFAEKFPDDRYLAEIAYQDWQVGRLLDEISGLGLRPRTLVVLTTDHGEGRGEHDEFLHSYFVYESTMRVPLILWGPAALPAGVRVYDLVRTVDIAPTILDLLGQPPLEKIQGQSLRPLLGRSPANLELIGYGESLELHGVFGVAPLRFVRDGRWKYIHKVNPELYDLVADPGELTNLAEAEPERVAELRSRLQTLVAQGSGASAEAVTTVDDRTRAQLATLGYAAPVAPRALGNEADSLELVGDDAATLTQAVVTLSEAQSHLQWKDYENARSVASGLLAKYPDSPHLLWLVGVALDQLGHADEAARHFRRALEQEPGNVDLARALVRALEKANRPEEAAASMRALLELDPCSEVRVKLYLHAHAQKRYTEQFQILAEGAERCPDSPLHLINFAWALATVPVDELRDGTKALALAKRSISMIEGQPGPGPLDTLAAAYAETGDFAQAVQQERRALETLEAQNLPDSTLAPFREHLEAFEAGRPIRDH
jgi:arylsulfatase A-like enzyme